MNLHGVHWVSDPVLPQAVLPGSFSKFQGDASLLCERPPNQGCCYGFWTPGCHNTPAPLFPECTYGSTSSLWRASLELCPMPLLAPKLPAAFQLTLAVATHAPCNAGVWIPHPWWVYFSAYITALVNENVQRSRSQTIHVRTRKRVKCIRHGS